MNEKRNLWLSMKRRIAFFFAVVSFSVFLGALFISMYASSKEAAIAVTFLFAAAGAAIYLMATDEKT